MGTQARIVFYARSETEARQAASRAFERIVELDDALSDWRADTELSRLNRLPPRNWHPVSQDLFDVLAMAQEVAQATDGAFDVTVGPLTQLWRRAWKSATPPSPEEIEGALGCVGWKHLHLNPANRTVKFALDGMALDLGGIGKGYACDEALEALRAAGIRRALVDIGGDLAASGPPPGERGWRIGIGNGIDRASVALAYEAIATSGDSERFLETSGERFSHIVAPRTGQGLTHRTQVTVQAKTAAIADALASAASVQTDAKQKVSHFAGARLVDFRRTSSATRTSTPLGPQ